jgi:hypothetical protein
MVGELEGLAVRVVSSACLLFPEGWQKHGRSGVYSTLQYGHNMMDLGPPANPRVVQAAQLPIGIARFWR